MAVPCTRLLGMAMLMAFSGLPLADKFLGREQQVTKKLVEEMLGELAAAKDSVRLAAIRRELRPMYTSLPKNARGQLDSSTVRYALHRYFVHKHGWYVKGLSPAAGSLTNSSSTAIVAEMAPMYIQAVLEQHLNQAGMQLEDLAVFAATLSDLVHGEGIMHLHVVYGILNISSTGDVSLASFNSALRGYLSGVVVGDFGPKLEDARGLDAVEAQAKRFYPEYDDLLMWLEDTRLTRDCMDAPRRNPFWQKGLGISPEEAETLMHDLYHKFGSLMNLECSATKRRLVAAEYPGTGRVSLAAFYGDSELQLSESVEYLRNQGALDEANPASLSLVIPNYMSSPSRCMPFSSYFSVCCPDDCESVLGRIEEAVAEPIADPKRIVDVVLNVPSDTQEAPRNLSAALVSRLDGIASRHRGQVPLHGRLFMQWLHHAYPHECPYPHESGTVNPATQDEWLDMHAHLYNVDATAAEKAWHAATHVDDLGTLEPLPWTDVEELIGEAKAQDVLPSGIEMRVLFRVIMMGLAVLSFAASLPRMAMQGSQVDSKGQAHFV